MDRSDRLAVVAMIAAFGALWLLTDLRIGWARPERGWYAPWVLWLGFVAAGAVIAGVAPDDDV